MGQPTFQITVPKTHPGLSRLLEAARKLPDVTVTSQSGVSVRRKNLLHEHAFDEFFQALEDVVGPGVVSEIQAGLRMPGDPKHLDPQVLAQRLLTQFPILPMLLRMPGQQ